MIKQTLLVLAVLSVGTVMMQQSAYAQSVPASMTIDNTTCGLAPFGGLAIGSVNKDSISLESTAFALTNLGNTDAIVEFYATDWLSGSDSIINGENTRVGINIQNTSFGSKILSNSTADNNSEIGKVVAGGTNSTYWQVDATLNSGFLNFQGALQQTITFAPIC